MVFFQFVNEKDDGTASIGRRFVYIIFWHSIGQNLIKISGCTQSFIFKRDKRCIPHPLL